METMKRFAYLPSSFGMSPLKRNRSSYEDIEDRRSAKRYFSASLAAQLGTLTLEQDAEQRKKTPRSSHIFGNEQGWGDEVAWKPQSAFGMGNEVKQALTELEADGDMKPEEEEDVEVLDLTAEGQSDKEDKEGTMVKPEVESRAVVVYKKPEGRLIKLPEDTIRFRDYRNSTQGMFDATFLKNSWRQPERRQGISDWHSTGKRKRDLQLMSYTGGSSSIGPWYDSTEESPSSKRCRTKMDID